MALQVWLWVGGIARIRRKIEDFGKLIKKSLTNRKDALKCS
jgi:hypothetical protein